jgi:transposase
MAAKEYTVDYKKQAVKLVKEVGVKQAATELNVPKGTLYGWIEKEKTGEIDLGAGSRTPTDALTLAAENKTLREKIKEFEKENARLHRENTFLEEASRFFAGSRQK